jgi:tripartite-type tricarboxylate transporter receptor subunit TctC
LHVPGVARLLLRPGDFRLYTDSREKMKKAVCLLATLSAWIACAQAQWPERPVRLITPYAAGGSTDLVARLVGTRLTERLGQHFVVDNRTGAGTLIGTEIAARAAPDGHTLLMATPPFVVNPSLHAKVPYDPGRDFVAVSNVAGSSNMLVAHPSLEAASTQDLIAHLKANPGKYAYGSSGVGGAAHLAMALFTSMAGVEATHVPYKGGAPAVADLVAGRLAFMMANLTTAQPHVRAGRLRGLAVGTARRSVLFPDLPTIAESGVPGYEATNWNGIVAPARTPLAIVERLQGEIAAALKEPALADRMLKAGLEPIGDTPAAFARYLSGEAAKWGQLVKTARIQAQ